MKLFITMITGLFVSMLVSCSQPTTLSVRQVVHPVVVTALRNDSATMQVTSTGSTVVIQPDLAITSYHVVNTSSQPPPYRSYVYVIINGSRVQADVVSADQRSDIAILSGPFGCPCASIEYSVKVDDEVVAVGYPLYSSYGTQFVTHGQVQSVTHTRLITTATAAPGSSGGGVFVNRGGTYKLVGIVAGAAAEYTALGQLKVYDWMGVSIPIQSFKQLLTDAKPSP